MWDPQSVADLGQQLRVDSIRSTSRAGSGQATSSLSAADLMAVLMAAAGIDAASIVEAAKAVVSKRHAAPPASAAARRP
jgi:transketolase